MSVPTTCPICQWSVEQFLAVCDIGRPLADEYRRLICAPCIAELYTEKGSRDAGRQDNRVAKSIDKSPIVRRGKRERRAA